MIYAGFVALDIIAIFPRMAGSIIQKNGIAYSFQFMTTTVKRLFVVTYPPLLGIISINGSIDDMFRIVLISYGAAILVWVAIFLFRIRIIAFFCASLEDFGQNGRLPRAIIAGLRYSSNWVDEVNKLFAGTFRIESGHTNIDKSIAVTAVWIFFFYSATPFIINIFGMKYSEYASVILQLTGVSSALGTLVLAFFLDPKLSRIYEDQKDLPFAFRSLIFSHLVNLSLICPLFFYTLSLFLT